MNKAALLAGLLVASAALGQGPAPGGAAPVARGAGGAPAPIQALAGPEDSRWTRTIERVASGIVTIQKGDPSVWPIAAGIAAIGLSAVLYAPHWLNKRRHAELLRQEADQASGPARPLPTD